MWSYGLSLVYRLILQIRIRVHLIFLPPKLNFRTVGFNIQEKGRERGPDSADHTPSWESWIRSVVPIKLVEQTMLLRTVKVCTLWYKFGIASLEYSWPINAGHEASSCRRLGWWNVCGIDRWTDAHWIDMTFSILPVTGGTYEPNWTLRISKYWEQPLWISVTVHEGSDHIHPAYRIMEMSSREDREALLPQFQSREWSRSTSVE